ncbi:MAG: CehA/McbA family metallohydrolase [Pelolinea sp.]|nr:CehA/McbA family metallohydrolase [Pelolinea sp.]
MFEITANIHIHTAYSDGSKYHADIAMDAISAGIDVIFITDHNIYVDGLEGYFKNKNGKVLMIMGEEIHDNNATQQKNHLLALGAGESFAHLSQDRQTMIKEIQSAGGISFLAHPYDPELPAFNEPDISWEDWSVSGYTGIELWNGFSDLKVRAKNKLATYFYAFFPKFLPLSPPQKTFAIWENLLTNGMKTVAIGGSDAHAINFSVGPLNRLVFPYKYHFSSINNHILLEKELIENVIQDKNSILNALKRGTSFIANDLIFPSKGFKFFIEDDMTKIQMGESHPYTNGMTLTIILPIRSDCRIMKNGTLFRKFSGEREIKMNINSSGIYRVECYKHFLGRKRGWIFSNPIYLE